MSEKKRRSSLFTRIFAVIGGITVALLVLGIIVAIFWFRPEGVPSNTILEVDLERQIAEYVPDDPIAQAMMGSELTMFETVDAITKAASDDNVTGLFVRVGNQTLGFGQAEELRDAVMHFRESGKPAVLFSETFGEVQAGHTSYYLATAFDEVFMQPSGDLGLAGLTTQAFFLQNILQEWGVEPQYEHRYEYKTAKYLFTEEDYTEPHREADSRVMESMKAELVQAIADSRGMDVAEVEELLERGPFFAREVLEVGLVDDLKYRDEVFAHMRSQLGDDAELLFVGHYRERAGTAFDSGPDVALIYGAGAVVRGTSGAELLFGTSMGSETVTAAFRAAVEDEVEAIIFRIDSPGGSYVASDAIWREVRRAQEAGIPVIATMGNVAGSGGYFVAMGAEHIIAQPSTITGSIGVVYGKFLTEEFWNELGINWREIASSESATMWSSLEAYNEHTEERLNSWLDHVYDDFTAKAAEGRGMTQEEIHEVARGRIWSGRDALEIGLIDDVGGFLTAIDRVRTILELEDDAIINIKQYPPKKTLIEQLMDRGPNSSERAAMVQTFQTTVEPLQPLLQTLHYINMNPADRALMMPGYGGLPHPAAE